MNEPLISLIIPVYNAGPWLAPCLASITAQTHPAWECILVDDGSTDGSPAACDQAAAADPRFRALHQVNAGPAAARQTGLEAARGDWLCFVDGDDWLPPEYLARLLALAREQNATMAACDMCRFTGKHPAPAPDTPSVMTLTGDGIRAALLRQARGMNWGLCSKLYHRSLLENYRFPAQVRHNEDLLANWQLLARCERAAVTDWPGYGYRQVDTSASHRLPGPDQLADHLAVADAILADAAGTSLEATAWAFHYEKLLFIDSMVLRQPASPVFAPLHTGVRKRLWAELGRALTCRGLAAWLKAAALLTFFARPLYRVLCRRCLPGGV